MPLSLSQLYPGKKEIESGCVGAEVDSTTVDRVREHSYSGKVCRKRFETGNSFWMPELVQKGEYYDDFNVDDYNNADDDDDEVSDYFDGDLLPFQQSKSGVVIVLASIRAQLVFLDGCIKRLWSVTSLVICRY